MKIKNLDVNFGKDMSPKKQLKEISRKSIVEKQKYEKAVSESKKLRTFIKSVVGRNINLLSKIEYDHVQIEYGENINANEISNGDDKVYGIWTEYNHQKVTDKNAVNPRTVFLLTMIEN